MFYLQNNNTPSDVSRVRNLFEKTTQTGGFGIGVVEVLVFLVLVGIVVIIIVGKLSAKRNEKNIKKLLKK